MPKGKWRPKPGPSRFIDVEFPSQFRPEDVADHEVYMSFRNDSDALAFHEWWADQGAVLFAEYLKTWPGEA